MLKKFPAFTIVEMIVVMAILGVLFTISAGGLISSQQKSRDARRKSDLNQIAVALEAYYNDKGEYPLSSAANKIVTDGCASSGGAGECDWGDPFVDSQGTTYMVKLPVDSQSSFSYHYNSDGTFFQLYARLENTDDISIERINDNPTVYDNIDCGGSVCNYGISSVNTTPEEGTSRVEE